MCGIVAEFSKKLQPPSKARIRAMAEDVKHRGPDDEGFYFENWFGLGFRRLSILDISLAGHQPMLDEQRNFVIVYNGELYNFKQIRQELTGKGYSFFSKSDTEVVLKSFIEWGPECLSRFVGMFAFIIINLNNNKVFAARDQLGIKPFYLYEDKDRILFASEIKCFRHYIKFELNESALHEQFFYRYVSGRQTIFKNIYRLSPGTYMEFDKSGIIAERRYYDVNAGLLNSSNSKIDLELVEKELNNSIYYHTQSDVGYNIQLSGGVDSSYITAALASDSSQKIHTFSVALKGYKEDESSYQDLVANQFNTIHHSFSFNGKDLADNLPRATWHMDFPLAGNSCPFIMLLCEYSGRHSKVILTGEGADELFAGYARYEIPFAHNFAVQLKRFGIRGFMLPSFWKFPSLKSLLSKDLGVTEQSILLKEKNTGLFGDLNKDIAFRKNISNKYSDLLRKIIAADQTSYLSFRLERQDKMTMASSVESRVPFCGYHLFDMINSINHKDKIKPVRKFVLKKISETYFDKEFVYRKKNGFNIPVGDWLRDTNNLGRYLDLLTDKTFKERGFYNTTAVSKAIDEHLKDEIEIDHSAILMSIIKFEIWHRTFIDGENTF